MINKTFRLFISSTFNDFILERNILDEEIFPVIDDFCQSKGYNFQFVDLRWGVNNESALNQNTLAICLDEVRRCRTLSPKPNFLIMAGERYGWIPLPTNISKSDFLKILSVATPAEISLITEWYILDENKIGGEYFLKTRSGKYVDDDVWFATESDIYSALLRCISSNADLSDDIKKIIESSATEQEIFEGLLECDGVSNNTIALFRNNYPERDENQEKIDNLKQRIIKKMIADDCEENIIFLEWGQEYQELFKRAIINILKKNISLEIERLEESSKENNADELDQILDSVEILFDKPSEVEKITSYLNGDNNKSLFVYGDSGSGKTTLLAQYIKSNIDNENVKYFYAFYGWSEKHYTLLFSLQNIINEIKTYYKISKEFNINEFNITETLFRAVFSIPEDRRAVIVIDGFDMFHDIADIKESILPIKLPSNVKIIISSADKSVINRFSGDGSEIIELEWFDKDVSEEYFYRLLKCKNRCISPKMQSDLVQKILEKGTTPLQLKLMADECGIWHSGDASVELDETVEAIACKYITNTYEKFGHNKDLVLYALALVAASPYGVTEEELQALLLRFEPVKKYFVSEDRYNHNLDKLPFAVWSRLFYDLKGCLALRRVRGFIVVKFVHNIFYRIFLDTFKNYYDEAADIMISYYYAQSDYVGGAVQPNTRKALSLSVLLKQTGKIHELADLLCEFSYIDSVVKIGNINEVISDLQYVITTNINAKEKEHLTTIYNYLQINRNMLNCYCSELYVCIQDIGSISHKSFITVENKDEKQSSIYFPYSLNSKLSWDNTGSKYAVFYGSYVYICNADSNTEICRIYLEPKDKTPTIAKNVLWMNDSVIGIVTSNNDVMVCDFHDGIPNITYVFAVSSYENCIKYSYVNNFLYVQEKDGIKALDVNFCKEVFSIKLAHKNKFGFEVDDSENVIYVKDTLKYISVFDAASGQLRKKEFIKPEYNYWGYFDLINRNDIYRISQSRWLIYWFGTRDKIAVYDTTEKARICLHPPYYYDIDKVLVGKKYLLLKYPDALLIIDLINNYKMRWLKLPHIKDVSWIIPDESLSVINNNRLYKISVDDFTISSEDEACCMTHKKNIFDSMFLGFKKINRYISKLIEVYNIFSGTEYRMFLSAFKLLDDIDYWLNSSGNSSLASIVVYANDASKAVVYEEENTLTVYSKENLPLIQIDKLKLSINDNILKISFSPDSEKLLIWRNDSVQVFDVNRGKKIFDLDVRWRPVLNVYFEEASQSLKLLLCDGNEYCCSLYGVGTSELSKLPKKLVSGLYLDEYFGPYNYYKNKKGKFLSYGRLDVNMFDLDVSPKYWFKSSSVYHGEKYWLYYKNGEFFLNGDKDKKFSHDFYDFDKCYQFELLAESRTIRCYLNGKNDLFSTIVEYGDEHLLLVSRMLNSVILFGINEMKVLSAYKVNGNIIGYRFDTDLKISITIDREPYQIDITVNI